MKISVLGCGYLGTVHAATLASLGHQVIGIDPDTEKIMELRLGNTPIHESGLGELLGSGVESGNLSFSTDPADARDCDVHFICVGTPQAKTTLDADLSQIYAAIDSLRPLLRKNSLVVGKSTVPVGTAALLENRLSGTGALLAWNPEFLRQGTAIADSLMPDRLVYGLPEGPRGELAGAKLDAVYSPLLERGTLCVKSNFATAELIKISANAFLALKLSYINAVAELCEGTGANVVELATALGADPRIGANYLNAGVGYGGGCLPKDVRSFRAQAQNQGIESLDELLSLVDGINADARFRAVVAAEKLLGGSVEGKKITILGASFKAHTDDIRDSPALDVAVQLAAQGAIVTVTDPQAARHTWISCPQLNVCEGTEQALRGSELLMLLTDWPEFTELDPIGISELVEKKTVFDGRNALNRETWIKAGWTYQGMGVGRTVAPAAL